MTTIVNPLDQSQFIDITGAFKQVQYPYGAFSKTGLFSPEYVTTRSIIAEVDTKGLGKMTGFTSLRERDAMRTSKEYRKAVPLAIPHMKIAESITYEDLANKVANWQSLTQGARDITVQDATLDRLERMSLALTQNMEYIALTAAQGIMRDPRDGSEVANMFDVLGVTRLTETLDLTDTTIDLFSWAQQLKARLQRASKVSPVIPVIDIVVDPADMQKITAHPSLAALRSNLLFGTGAAGVGLASTLLYSTLSLTQHGISEVFDLGNGVRFITYPVSFTRYDGTVVEASVAGKAFTVLRGVSDLYRSVYAPAPYFSYLGQVAQETYAWRTPIKHDQQFEVLLETSPLFYMTQPELSVDITVVS